MAACPSATQFERPPRDPRPAPKPNVGPAVMDRGLLDGDRAMPPGGGPAPNAAPVAPRAPAGRIN